MAELWRGGTSRNGGRWLEEEEEQWQIKNRVWGGGQNTRMTDRQTNSKENLCVIEFVKMAEWHSVNYLSRSMWVHRS